MGTQLRKTTVATPVTCALLLALPALAAAEDLQFTPWTDPVHLGPIINSSAQELAPELSPNGLSLYFASNRVATGSLGGFDIWVSRRACETCPWEAPVVLGPNVNSPGDEISPAFSDDGRLLFFASAREGSMGDDTDIWVSHRKNKHNDFGWGPPVNLGPFVNTDGHETSPAFLPGKGKKNPRTLYFVRSDDVDQDIYGTELTKDGMPVRLGTPIVELDHADPALLNGDPGFRGDGLELIYFAGPFPAVGLEIFSATRASRNDAWSNIQNLGPPVNSRFADFTPGITFDGRTLSSRPARAAAVWVSRTSGCRRAS